MKILRGAQNFLDTRKGGSENLYTSKPTGGGETPKNWTASEGGLLKFQASSFNIFIPPCHIKSTFPYYCKNCDNIFILSLDLLSVLLEFEEKFEPHQPNEIPDPFRCSF